jgi:hypothetical protein
MLHFKGYSEAISAYSFNSSLLSYLPKVQLLSLSNALVFQPLFHLYYSSVLSI